MKGSIIRLSDYLCYFAIVALMFIGFSVYNIVGAIGGGGFRAGRVLDGSQWNLQRIEENQRYA